MEAFEPIYKMGTRLASSAAKSARGYYRTAAEAAAFLPQPAMLEVYENTGVNYGLGPAETLQTLAGLTQQTGGGGPSNASWGAALAGRSMGVDLGTTGGLYRTLRAGYGGRSPGIWGDTLARLTSSAAGMNLTGSDAPEFLAYQVNLAQEAAAGGDAVNYPGVTSLITGLAGRGDHEITGFGKGNQQASRVVTGTYRGLRGIGMSGAQDAIGVAAIRAAGWEPGSGASGYAEALEKLEHDPSKYMGRFLEIVGKAGGDQWEKGLITQRVMQRLGVQVNQKQARTLAGGLTRGEVGAGTAEEMEAMAQLRRGAYGQGIPEGEADLKARELKLGKGFAQTDLRLQAAQLKMIESTDKLSGLFSLLAVGVEKVATVLDRALKKLPDTGPVVPYNRVTGR
jgi:hypothetical protein